MIVLIEPVCYGWVHEEVNAGFLKLVKEVTGDEIVYIGEQGQVACVRKLFDEDGIIYKRISRLLDKSVVDSYESTWYYLKLLCHVLGQYHPNHMFVMCAYRPCILAAEIASMLYRKCQVAVILHGMVEATKGRHESYKKLIWLGSLCNYLKFITYSPYCSAKYWNIPDSKMIFIHHPYIKRKEKHKKTPEEKCVIGIIGGCANKAAFRFIQLLYKMLEENKVEIWVVSRFAGLFKKQQNVKLIDSAFKRKDIEILMEQMDFLLIPYGKNEYVISASGVLWDAVSNKIPCLMLNSPYLEYYKKYNLGYIADELIELVHMLSEKTTVNKEKTFFNGIEEFNRYNIMMMKNILKD